jgi:hypothetical protein
MLPSGWVWGFLLFYLLEGGRGKGGYWKDVGGSIESKRNELALVVTGWGYGLWAIADVCTDSYIGFYVAMGGAMGRFSYHGLCSSTWRAKIEYSSFDINYGMVISRDMNNNAVIYAALIDLRWIRSLRRRVLLHHLVVYRPLLLRCRLLVRHCQCGRRH